MISSGFAEDEPVIDVHDDFGGGLGKIHEGTSGGGKRLSLERENQIHAYFSENRALPVYKISSPTKGHRDHRPTSTSTANTPSSRYHVPGITHDVRRAICTR